MTIILTLAVLFVFATIEFAPRVNNFVINKKIQWEKDRQEAASKFFADSKYGISF